LPSFFFISALYDFAGKSKILSFIRLKMGKKGSLQAGGLGMLLGIMSVIGGIFGFYN